MSSQRQSRDDTPKVQGINMYDHQHDNMTDEHEGFDEQFLHVCHHALAMKS